MTRPWPGARLAGAALGWLAGVAAQLQQPALAPRGTYAVCLSGGLLLLLLTVLAGRAGAPRPSAAGAAPGARWRAAAGLAALVAAAALAGYGSAGRQASARLADGLDPALERVDLEVVGVVAGLPRPGAQGVRFPFEIEAARRGADPVRVPRLVSLGWSAGFDDEAAPRPAQRALAAGQRWRFTVRLRRPHGQMNPHGHDHELALFEQGVRATGQVRDAPAALLAETGAWRVDRWRQRVRDAIGRAVPDARVAGVLAALAVGDQAAISRDDWGVFRDTGVAHLMSISGLHVTMFAWLAGGLLRAAWSRRRRAALLLPAPTAARWGGLAAAAAYAAFAGWGVPAQRTVWMIGVAALLRSVGRRWPWPLVLLAAACAVTAFDPWALLQPGFWLSFTAVGILLASAPGGASREADAAPPPPPGTAAGRLAAAARRLARAAAGGVRTQAVATVALTPLTLVYFQQVSLVGFVANLAAIPLVTLLVTPLALLGVAFAPLWTAAAWLVGRLAAFLGWLAGWPGAVWAPGAAPWWAQAAGLLGGLLLVLPLPARVRLAALPLALPLLLPPHALPPHGAFELLAADVGQGSAVLVRTRHRLLVYDSGPRYARDSDAGGRVLLPLLRALGEPRVDLLVVSHRDSDHAGGAGALLRGVPVARLSSSLEPGHPLLVAGVPHTRCEAGQRWEWDGVRFEVLHPPAEAYARPARPNRLSCVLRVEGEAAAPGRPRSALLAGDIERGDEAALVAARGAALASEVLLVPHHGSRTSSSAAFVEAVRPRVAVVQAGYLNRFGHPAPEVAARYAAAGATLVDTARCGAWRDAPGQGAGGCERERRRRYWHHPGEADARR